MTRSSAAIAALIVCLASTSVRAQAPRPGEVAPAAPQATAKAAGTQVAIIDIGYIFKNLASYNAKRDALREKTKALQNEVAQQRKHLSKENEKLQELQPGSLDYKRVEAQLTQQASDFQVQNELQRKALVEEEIKLYYDTYLEVQRVIDSLAAKYNIDLVVRYDREKMDPADPDSVRRGLLNSVVYHRGLDLTDAVLAELNRVAQTPRPTTR